ncbi:MAG: endonuclease/exonuclease/phosphatase family protein, partial [Bradymonadaceae bacterium]
RVASWNVQSFSAGKARNHELLNQIAEKMKNFDLVAVQEISNVREKSDPDCPRNTECPKAKNCGVIREALDEQLNDNQDDNYGITISPQVRHERYMYVYDKDQVQLLDHRLVHDPGDSAPVCAYRPENTGTMVRQPFLGVFQADDFSFAMLNVHVAPKQANAEIDALLDFQDRLREEGYSDVIVAGDLNADCRYLSQKQQDELATSEHHWLFRGADTAVAESRECGYDQMIATRPTLEDLTGKLGVAGPVDEKVSDHFPIWANFYIHRDTDRHDISKLSD